MNYITIENALCDFVDSIFDDAIKSTMELKTDLTDTRAIHLAGGGLPDDDQNGRIKRFAKLEMIRRTRNDLCSDISKAQDAFPIYGRNFGGGLVLTMSVRYITPPTKMVVETVDCYFSSIDFNLTSN